MGRTLLLKLTSFSCMTLLQPVVRAFIHLGPSLSSTLSHHPRTNGARYHNPSIPQHHLLWSTAKELLDQQAEFVKAELARKQEEYNAKMKSQMKEKQKASGAVETTKLQDLPLISYLDEQGKISDPGAIEKVKASVYAIYDQENGVQYIGVSRNVAQSLRLHLARVPEKTYGYKVFHITKPNRVLLELTRDSWIEEIGAQPAGNDNGPMQASWENPLDVKPLLTSEDYAALEDARNKQKSEDNAMKKVTRRFEQAKIEVLSSRGVTESLRFDPKLKGKGMLDLYLNKPDDSVPTSKPSTAKK